MSLLILIRNPVEIRELVVMEVMGPLLHPTMNEMIAVTKIVVSLQAVVLEVVVLLGGVHLESVVRLAVVVHLVLVEMTHRR